MDVNSAPRLHLATEVAAEGAKSLTPALVGAGIDANKLKGMEAELDAFAKAGLAPAGIGGDQFAGLFNIIGPEQLSALLGRDGYIAKPGDLTLMIANRAFIGGGYIDRVCRDTGIRYNTAVGGGVSAPGCTWMTLSNPQKA